MFRGVPRSWDMTLSGDVASLGRDPGSDGQPGPTPPPARQPLSAAEWTRLIREHQRRVVLSLVAAGFEFRPAEELAHEAWARLMEKDRQGRLPELKLPGLVIAQARYLSWEERRRETAQRHRTPAAGEAAEELVVDRNPDPEQRLLTRQQASRALDAVAAAPASAQRLFHLLYAQPRLPHAEAARLLGLSVQRVRQILCELRKSVRAAIEGDQK